jgi:hypothetical protein
MDQKILLIIIIIFLLSNNLSKIIKDIGLNLIYLVIILAALNIINPNINTIVKKKFNTIY